MIFVPYNTDAPVYHLPISTGVLMAVHCVTFFCTTWQVHLGNFDQDSILWLTLQFDQINPLQWLTFSFMHSDVFVLCGNMFFLWSFGLVVEGKVGNKAFPILYFMIAITWAALVQIPGFLFGSDIYAQGSACAIFGLMMIAGIWAPENEMDCFYWAGFRVGTTEVSIFFLGIVFIGLQFALLCLMAVGDFGMPTDMLHVLAAALGAPIGFYMLRQEMVDCEGWDVVSRNDFLHKNSFFCKPERRERMLREEKETADPVAFALASSPTRPAKPKTIAPPAAAQPTSPKDESLPEAPISQEDADEAAARRLAAEKAAIAHPEFNRLTFVFRQAIDMENLASVGQTFFRLEQMNLSIGLSDKLLFQYVGMLGKHSKPAEMLRPLTLIAERGGLLADEARLRIGLIQLRVLKKPDLALRTLRQIRSTEAQPVEPEVIRKRDALIQEAAPL